LGQEYFADGCTAFVTFVEYPASSNLVIISSKSMDFKAPIPILGELEITASSSVALKYGDAGAFGAFKDLGLMTFFFTNIDSFGCWLCDGCRAPEGGASETWSTSPEFWALLTALCPLPTDADRVGEGGGWGEAGRGLGATSDSVAGTESIVGFEPPDLALPEDFCDMDLSRCPLVTSAAENELLGLSDFAPGIFERNPRNERDDSLVSDLLNEGYDCNVSLPDLSREVDDAFLGVLEPSLDFEGCWPILPSTAGRSDHNGWIIGRVRRSAVGIWLLCIAFHSQATKERR